jgi:hypothetical protein
MTVSTENLLRVLLSSDEAVLDLQEAALESESEFISDIQKGASEAETNELVPPDRARRLTEMLSLAKVMPGFDSPAFREWVLACWRCTVPTHGEGFSESEISAYETLTEEYKVASEKLQSDFVHVLFDQYRVNLIRETVKKHLQLNQCGKALKVLRTNAVYLSTKFLNVQRALVWQSVAAMDPRFGVIAGSYRWGIDHEKFVIFGPTTSVERQAGRDDSELFIEDLKKLASRTIDKVDEVRQRSIVEKLAYAETMKHFDSMAFRSYILLCWNHLVDDQLDRTLYEPSSLESVDRIVEAKKSLSPSALTVADEVIGDFSSLFVKDECKVRIRKSVETALRRNECGTALDLIREAAPDLDPTITVPLLGQIWSQISKFDVRFEPIALGFCNFSPVDQSYNI